MSSVQQVQETPVPGQPPSAQEIQRKLSVAQRKGKTRAPIAQNSGTDTEEESIIVPSNEPASGATTLPTSQPLSAIAEHTLSGGEESEEEEEDVAGPWRQARSVEGHLTGAPAGKGSIVLHNGYLWKKGSGRRKTWKKRWFVLRPTHLACYKTSAEYKLLRLLDVSDIHAATSVQLKRHPNSIGIVTQARTFYYQAESSTEMDEWISKINEAKEALQSASIPGTPVAIPPSAKPSNDAPSNTPSPPKPPTAISILVPTTSPSVVFTEPTSPVSAIIPASRSQQAHMSNTSSDSDEAPVSVTKSTNPPLPPGESLTRKDKDTKERDPRVTGKPVMSGYLMKCSTHRKIWRKRWFVLTPTKLIYMGSHMDAKPHREFMLNQILDAMEYRPSSSHGNRHASPNRPHAELSMAAGEGSSSQRGLHNQQSSNTSSQLPDEYTGSGVNYTFKVITPKKTLLLSAPSEEEEVKWISAIRALIARRMKEKEEKLEPSAGHSREKDPESTSSPAGIASGKPPPAGGEHIASNEEKKKSTTKSAHPALTSMSSSAGANKSGTATAVDA